MIILLGEHDRSKHEGTEQEFLIDCIHIHRRYVKGVPYVNDIAVIKLKTSPGHDVLLNDYVMPACLPEKNEFRTYGHHSLLILQAPNFCASCVSKECLVTWSTHAHKQKFPANL